MKRQTLWTVLFVLTICGVAQAQGTQTGTISGAVQSPDGLAFPGVSVSVKSPSLQGVRSSTTDQNGSYIFKALPPGTYLVTFQVSGMQTLEKTAQLELGRAITVDATLAIGTVTETVTVSEAPPGIVETASGGANYRAAEIDTLPTGRTVFQIAELAPGLTDNTPNPEQISVSGSFSYDNVFLVDGVDVNDNLFGTINNLFIEEAIEEQAVITSGISAEYGRFSGGIVNTITKHGGNTFQGSLRANFTNAAWRYETPYELENGIQRVSKTNPVFEATLGGPILVDRLWFFLAGRSAKTDTAGSYPDLGQAVTTKQDNKRMIAKLTGTVARNHTVTGTWTYNATTQDQPSFSITASSGLRSIDPRTYSSRSLPNSLIGINYNGVLSSNLFVEAQVSRKKFNFKNSGGTNTNVMEGSPFITMGIYNGIGGAGHYNAPYFDATDPEDRDNRQVSVALSYFLSTGKLGRHDIKVGYENYRSTNTGGNSQSPTDYVFYADYVTDDAGKPLLADGRYQPIWVNGENLRLNWIAARGARIDVTTQSFYVNDSWEMSKHLSANLGARFEMVKSKATGGIVGIDTSTIVPRLALSYDVLANQRIRLDASYARYAGKYSEAQIGTNTSVGNPSYLYQYYIGPDGVGAAFTPAYDPANWVTFGGSVPTVNVKFDKNLHSPVTDEFTFGASYALPRNGYLKAIYTNRKMASVIETFTDTTTGSSSAVLEGVEVGPFDNVVYRNSSLPTRKYQGISLISSLRPLGRWSVNANYTLQLQNYGDFEGEGRNLPGISSTWGDYPEIFVESRNFPLGRLAGFQRHKVRAWTYYDLDLGRAGVFTPSLLYRYDSATTGSLAATTVPLSSIQQARIPASYASPPTNQTLYFGERGCVDFAGAHVFDLGLNYSLPVWRTVRPWVKLELRNALNDDTLTTWNIAVTPDNAGPKDADGLPTNYVKGRNYGKGTGTGNYPVPREFLFSVGVRF
jgi:hypothetical protein